MQRTMESCPRGWLFFLFVGGSFVGVVRLFLRREAIIQIIIAIFVCN